MKLIIEIPDKMLDVCRGLMSLIGEDDDDDKELFQCIEEMKGQEVKMDADFLSSEKSKQFYLGLLMVAIGNRMTTKKAGN